jgi:hypothetical protein
MDIAVISPVSPFEPRDGHTLAVLSDVHAALDNGLSLGVIAFTYGAEKAPGNTPCAIKLIEAGNGGAASRFFRGFVKGLAPSLERLYTSDATLQIRTALKAWMPKIVILDDASVAGYMNLVREIVPAARVILRSHNVMHDVRKEQLEKTTGLLRLPVSFDCQRYLAFERRAVESCDEHWSITQADAQRMIALYGRPCSHFSVSLPLESYTRLTIEAGRNSRFIHVGTVDFRRRSDLKHFLSVSWPKLLAANPEATLTMAGKLYGSTIKAPNVTYTGPVASDTEVYKEGQWALNFQRRTGGLKLKTLTSMAAGRVLISTPQGVEGLQLSSGHHYWDLNALLDSPNAYEILRDQRKAKAVAEAGREYVVSQHSRTVVAKQFQNLLGAASNTTSPASPQVHERVLLPLCRN